jgi:hypothetical protein
MKQLLFVMLIFSIFQARARGHDQGNGGVGVFCENSEGQKNLQLFDLYEGQILLGLTPVATGADFKRVASLMLTKFSDLFPDQKMEDELQNNLSETIQKLNILPSGVGLELTEDVGNFIRPKSCDIVQIVNYRNTGEVYIDSDLWNILDSTHKAASLVHEAIYWYLRQAGNEIDRQTGKLKRVELDSARVRKIVSYLFSNLKLKTLGTEAGGPNGNRIKCSNQDDLMAKNFGSTEFVLLKDLGRVKGRFIRINGKLMVARSEIVFELLDGLQQLNLISPIDQGISFDFFKIPNLENLRHSGQLSIVVKDKSQLLDYQSAFKCYLY